jgi:hypothetical protein
MAVIRTMFPTAVFADMPCHLGSPANVTACSRCRKLRHATRREARPGPRRTSRSPRCTSAMAQQGDGGDDGGGEEGKELPARPMAPRATKRVARAPLGTWRPPRCPTCHKPFPRRGRTPCACSTPQRAAWRPRSPRVHAGPDAHQAGPARRSWQWKPDALVLQGVSTRSVFRRAGSCCWQCRIVETLCPRAENCIITTCAPSWSIPLSLCWSCEQHCLVVALLSSSL